MSLYSCLSYAMQLVNGQEPEREENYTRKPCPDFLEYRCRSSIVILWEKFWTDSAPIQASSIRWIIDKKISRFVVIKEMHSYLSFCFFFFFKKISMSIQRLTFFVLLCGSAILVNVIVSPWFFIAAIPTCAAYYIVQKFYRCSAKHLQRLDGRYGTYFCKWYLVFCEYFL